jgi:sugar phosphate permease
LANASFFVSLLSITSVTVLVNYTVFAWTPTYMIRVHGLDVKTAGLEIGTIFVISGIMGSVFGSWVMSRSTGRRALGHVVRTMVRLSFVSFPLLVLMALAPTPTIALTLLAVAFFLLAAMFSSVLTPLALVAPSYLRARVTAVGAGVNGVIGGCGPLVVGALTDFVFKTPNRISDSLAITFAATCVIGLIAGPSAARLATRIDDMRSPVAPEQ